MLDLEAMSMSLIASFDFDDTLVFRRMDYIALVGGLKSVVGGMEAKGREAGFFLWKEIRTTYSYLHLLRI